MLDALDECHTQTGSCAKELLPWIRDLLGSGQKNIRLFATSRLEQGIQSTLNELVDEDHRIPIQSDFTGGDINAYIRTRIKKGDSSKGWRKEPNVQEEIEVALMQKTDGI